MRAVTAIGFTLTILFTQAWSQKTPMFYGWFFNEITANGLKEITENYLTELYGNVREVQVFLMNVSAIAKIPDPLHYYTKPVDPNTGNFDPFYHITTFYCGTEDCSDYSRRIAPYLQQIFTSHLVGVFFTPRTYGIRVNLTSLQREIFDMNESNANSRTIHLTDDPCDAQLFNEIQFCLQDDTNLHPTDTRAHITLGCAPNISAVTTGLDLIDILRLEMTPNQFCTQIQTGRGNLVQMGENCDTFVYYLKKKMVTNSTFQVYYNSSELLRAPCQAHYFTVFVMLFLSNKFFS